MRPASLAPTLATSLAQRALAALPTGRTLPADVWLRRHRVMLGVVWAHVAGLLVFGLAIEHADAASVLLQVGCIAMCAIAASMRGLSRVLRATMLALGALSASATLVHLAHGSTEAHFHFFVVIAMLASYEEWVPYLISIAFVVLHHGLLGAFYPKAVYDHGDAVADPWKWALIHAAFVLALSAVNIVSWRLNEDARAGTRRSEAEFRGAFRDAPVGMAIVGLDGRVLRSNSALASITGRSVATLVDADLRDLLDPLAAEELDAGGDVTSVETAFARRDGSQGWALVHRSLVRDDDGSPRHYVAHVLDLTERRDAEARLEHQTWHDELTGLPNRGGFNSHVRRALEASGDGQVAVLFVDLDDFKTVNDSLGHRAGDGLVNLVARRLAGGLRGGDVLARFGGDEFCVLAEGVRDTEEALGIAERLRDALHLPFVIAGEQRHVTASIGVCVAPRSPVDPDSLVRDADAAMYRAKERGKARSELFHDELREQVVERLQLEDGLRHAVQRGELELHYQPEIDLRTGRTVACEALLRWHHAERGMVSPASFIPIAEQTGLIVPIGAWVLDEACRQAASWRAAGVAGGELVMSVNLSPRQFAALDLVGLVRGTLERHGLPAELLCLEITESAVMADPDQATITLAELSALGVKLAIDDFGTGYSSLGHLKHLLPVDVLKIDRSFVRGIAGSREDRAIVAAVVDLARTLGLTTVAEGVEEPEQAEALRDLRCTIGQGFMWSRPKPAAVLDAEHFALPAAA